MTLVLCFWLRGSLVSRVMFLTFLGQQVAVMCGATFVRSATRFFGQPLVSLLV